MGRIREFDIDDALAGAMGVFWRKGYQGASMQDIEAATGLNKQSLYRVFPDKRAMYLAALTHYERVEMNKTAAVLQGSGNAQEKFGALFDGAVAVAAKGDRSGCFLCNAATDQGQQDEETTEMVSAAMRRLEKLFREGLSSSSPYNRDDDARDAKAAALMAAYLGIRVLTKANAPLRLIKTAVTETISTI